MPARTVTGGANVSEADWTLRQQFSPPYHFPSRGDGNWRATGKTIAENRRSDELLTHLLSEATTMQRITTLALAGLMSAALLSTGCQTNKDRVTSSSSSGTSATRTTSGYGADDKK